MNKIRKFFHEDIKDIDKDKKLDPLLIEFMSFVLEQQTKADAKIKAICCWLGLVTGSIITILLGRI